MSASSKCSWQPSSGASIPLWTTDNHHRARTESVLMTCYSYPTSQANHPHQKSFVFSQCDSSIFVLMDKGFAFPSRISFTRCTYCRNEWATSLLRDMDQVDISFFMLLEWNQLRAELVTHVQRWGELFWLGECMHKCVWGECSPVTRVVFSSFQKRG